MQILDNVIILTLIVIAFFVGKIISDKYHAAQIEQLEYQLRLWMAERGVGYIAPQTKKVQIGQPFMDRLKENGRAIQQLKK